MTEMKQEPQDGGSAQEPKQISTIEQKLIEGQVLEMLRTCYDPEIPVNIHELGLIYDVRVALDGGVLITMTLTTPHCPAAQSLPREVEMKARTVPGVTDVKVNIVWEPSWNPSMMTEAARLELGMQ